jgi:hypothetical protein
MGKVFSVDRSAEPDFSVNTPVGDRQKINGSGEEETGRNRTETCKTT